MADDFDVDALFPAKMVGAPTSVHQRTVMEYGSGSLLLASTLVRAEENIDDMGSVAATEEENLIVGSRVVWQTDCASGSFGALAVFHLRHYTPVFFTNHDFSWRKFEGVFSSSTLHRIESKTMVLEGLFPEALDALWFQNLRNHHATEAMRPGPLRSLKRSSSALVRCRMTPVANAMSGISWNGVTRPSRGSKNLTVCCRWHFGQVTCVSRCTMWAKRETAMPHRRGAWGNSSHADSGSSRVEYVVGGTLTATLSDGVERMVEMTGRMLP